tara:strand:+ start:963 stop:1112 length:150 start_codon:yes stop_codon:yes gene_type:complete
MFFLCSLLFNKCSVSDSPYMEIAMTMSRFHELFALALMFTAGYACMVVG